MTLTENPAADAAFRNFRPLATEFNKSAMSFATLQGTTWEALNMKYSILKKFKVEEASEQISLSASLFECAETILRNCAKTDWRTNMRQHDIDAVFKLMMQEKELPFLPERASEKLVDIALDLVRAAEKVKEEYKVVTADQAHNHRTSLLRLAGEVSCYAETLRGVTHTAASFTPTKAPMAAPAKLRAAQVLPAASN